MTNGSSRSVLNVPKNRGALQRMHESLDEGFRALRAGRDETSIGHPLFALEHGLDEEQLDSLMDEVRSWLRSYRPSPKWWLPFIVYATEVGYGYEGDEYWDTFAAVTPGWDHEDRRYFGGRFREFAKRFGGFVPTGPWARHFSIICWPITHSVLPSYLQQQLARMLYDNRALISAELLAQPPDLGRALAARTGAYRKRFQQFAENTELLGVVSSALLIGEQQSPLLRPSTLHRIVSDLSKERQSRRWLDDARRSADRVRMRGVSSTAGARSHRTGQITSPKPTPPAQFTLHRGAAGWDLSVRVPDFSPLFARHPQLIEELGLRRCRVNGFLGAPRPSGWLRFAGVSVTLTSWPGRDRPVFALDGGSAEVNALVADECRTPSSPAWLFRHTDAANGILVRTSTVRPGQRYTLLGELAQGVSAPWITSAQTSCSGATAIDLDVPPELSEDVLSILERLRIASHGDISIDPVGAVAAAWDGEGVGEWIAGDRPLLQIGATRQLLSGSVRIDGVPPVELTFKAGPTYIDLGDLPVGDHDVNFTLELLGAEDDTRSGRLHVRIRQPRVGSPSGTFQEPLFMLPTPATPTMEDLWEGRSTAEVIGPVSDRARMIVALRNGDSVLVRREVSSIPLPLSHARWQSVFSEHVRGRREFQNAFDAADSVEVEIRDSELGSVSLRADRGPTPLRWRYIAEADRTRLRLRDDLDLDPEVTYYTFEAPNAAIPLVLSTDRVFATDGGGLFVARGGEHVSAAVLPQRIRTLEDLRASRVHCRVAPISTNKHALIAHLALGRLWSIATTPGDPFASLARASVVDALAGEVCGRIGGERWMRLEEFAATSHTRISETRISDALSRDRHDPFIAAARVLAAEPPRSTDELVIDFGRMLDGGATSTPLARPGLVMSDAAKARLQRLPALRLGLDGRWLSEFLLRLASDCGTVLDWSGASRDDGLAAVLAEPRILRAARLLVLAQRETELRWQWQ